jgi:hypothetical protein
MHFVGSAPPSNEQSESTNQKSSSMKSLSIDLLAGASGWNIPHRSEKLMAQAVQLMRKPDYPSELDFVFFNNSLPDLLTLHQPVLF